MSIDMENLAFEAMWFCQLVHKGQKRKYTNNPYWEHPAEVVGIVSSVDARPTTLAAAWLHETREDQGITHEEIVARFGEVVAQGVALLSDLETGNRATRKAASRARLAAAPGWVQNIKCADLISNTSSIRLHDPVFAIKYLEEKRQLLAVMTQADPRLLKLASALCVAS